MFLAPGQPPEKTLNLNIGLVDLAAQAATLFAS
jgi:hypothetical protein